MGRGVRFESGWGDEMEEVRLSMGRVQSERCNYYSILHNSFSLTLGFRGVDWWSFSCVT